MLPDPQLFCPFSAPADAPVPFWLKLPPLAVYGIVNLDEMVKVPAVYLHYKRYIWVRGITRQGEMPDGT